MLEAGGSCKGISGSLCHHCVWEEPQGNLVMPGTSSLSQWWGPGSHSCSSCAVTGSAEPVCVCLACPDRV